jgi:hypothetical protein
MSGAGPPPSNPFATRYTRPGALGFRFPPGGSVDLLVERLRQHDWQGQIVGPHGSGKSSLLAALAPALAAAGRQVATIRLRDGQRKLPAEIDPRGWNSSTLVVVDGYEQLGRWARWRLQRWRRRRGCGMLVTAHASVGLPTLWRTEPTADLLAEIVGQLLEKPALEPVELAIVEAAFARRGGDLREALFDLFDQVERGRWPSGGFPP